MLLSLDVLEMSRGDLQATGTFLLELAASRVAHPQKDDEAVPSETNSEPTTRRGRPRKTAAAVEPAVEKSEGDKVFDQPHHGHESETAPPAPAEEDLFGEATPVTPETPSITMDQVVDAAKALGKRTSLNRVQALLQDDMKLPVGTKIKDVPADRWAELVTLANAIS